VFFSGIRAAQLGPRGTACPYNGYYDVPVREDLTCYWDTGEGSDPRVRVRLAVPSAQVRMGTEAEGGVFQSWDLPSCTRWFENQLIWENRYWFKGQAWVGGAMELAAIIESVTPLIDPDPRMECFPIEEEEIVVRYAGKRDATNIAIKFDTNP